MQTPALHTARIKHIQKLTDTVYEFTYTFLDTTPMQFSAGQYGTVIIDSTNRRQYSFCSDPKHTDTVSMVIDTKPMGPGSMYFLSKKIGDAIQMLAPLGNFVLEPSPRKKLFVATGTGIAPIKSMILDAIQTMPIILHWGLRHETDMYWDKEFTELAKKHPTFQYNLVLSKPETQWQGKTGHVTDHLAEVDELLDTDYYLCGNKQMISDAKELLLAHHVPDGQIKTEMF
ncbi:MAG: FAD-binding oxidoreductase [Microgenomates group bacterium]